MLFSYIIPVFNCMPYLRECVDCITAQGTDSYEILLVDDGSTDGSGALCDDIQANDKHVKVIHKQNGGAASARNVGIEAASGRYLFFIDGDDTIAPDCIERLLPCLESEDRLPIFGMAFDFWQNGALRRTDKRSAAFKGEFPIGRLAADLPAFFEDNVLSSACNKLFSAAVIEKNHLRFPEGVTLYEDLSFVLRYLTHVDSVICVPEPLYHYRNELNANHLSRRLSELGTLRQNLVCLNQALLDFGARWQCLPPAASVGAELSMQLLSQHLLLVPHTVKEYAACLPAYCSEPSFLALLTEAPPLSADSAALLEDVTQKRFRRIHRRYRLRRAKRALRQTLKKILKR